MGRIKSYKTYFTLNRSTPVTIPRRTRHRLLNPKRLNLGLFQDPRPASESQVISTDNINNAAEVETQSETTYDSDSGSSASSVEEEGLDSEPLLFPSCRITKKESLLLIYGFILRHKIPNCAVSDLLALINFHLPEGSNVPASTFLLEKKIAPDYSLATKHFYCPKCETSVETQNDACRNCDLNIKETILGNTGNFFLSFNLRSSLEKVVSMPSIGLALQTSLTQRDNRDPKVLKDIIDGGLYKMLPIGPFDISCSINTDGVNIFHSSKLSIWPILVSINELPYHLRRKHTVLAGLWFGYKKPNFDVFLSPFIEQCNELSIQPVTWKIEHRTYESKIYFPIVAADSVARCTLQGIKQFNGEYGCPWCLAPGKTLEMEGNKRKWIYPPETFPRRSPETFIDNLNVLKQNLNENTSDSYMGVKSASQLLLLKNFNIVDGFVFDYMHTCLLGVVKTMTMIWFDSANHKENYYIGRREAEISQIYLNCKVPFECNRVTRELKDISYWKANEWKSWMILCVPLLQNFLRDVFLKHFAKFVYAISILNSQCIERESVDFAGKLLSEFCTIAPNLYGMKICTFNMHLLTHAVDCVKNWGPLWAYSLFQYEHNNGILTSYFSGTSQVCMQIVKKVILTQQVHSLGRCGFQNPIANDFFVSLVDFKTYCKKAIKTEVRTFLGVKRKYVFSMLEKQKLERIGIMVSYGWSFKTVIIKGIKYNVSSSDTKKSVNSICSIRCNLYQIDRLIIVEHGENDISLALCKRITTIPVGGLRGTYKVVNISESFSFQILTNSLPKKYLCLYNENKILCYICELLNTVELE